jgi:Protein of unknown function (DUF3830)
MNRPPAIQLRFVEEEAAASAVLLWERAPQTCAAIVARLPVEGEAHHAIYSGSECVHVFKESLQLEKEHATSRVQKGQVGFAWLAAGSAYGVEVDISEICWFYDLDAQPRMWEGPVEVNIFAEIREPAAAFYAACRRMRREGVKPIRIEVDCP